ncbi:glycosyltransferase [uncultured Dokdonia sp.]|uniref:glycosyltransferase n=1 Tax=Dokdonia sp. R78006 TaxID=3093866 RepID=UPI00263626D3|nr:glycosyltransferase [uncultured Dokdonia sp.]
MKILQLIDTLDAGGAERMAVNIANAVNEEGITSYLCATRRAGPLENELSSRVNFLMLGKKGKLDLVAFRRFFKWLKKEQITIIHAHSTSLMLAVLAKINKRSIKIVWHDHYGMSDALEKRDSKLLKILARYIDVTIAVNEKLKTWSREVLGVKQTYFLENFAALSSDKLKVISLKGKEGKRVICLANLRPQKNHIELIEAFSKTQNSFQEWTLHLVGKSFEDDYYSELTTAIEIHNLSDKVFLYGSCNDIAHILEQSTIGVLSSISEGLPVSLLEYGNSSLPVIVTNVGQCAAVVGNNGIVINNVREELSKELVKLFHCDQKERDQMGLRFRESVLKNYSKKAFMDKVLPIYKGLIS